MLPPLHLLFYSWIVLNKKEFLFCFSFLFGFFFFFFLSQTQTDWGSTCFETTPEQYFFNLANTCCSKHCPLPHPNPKESWSLKPVFTLEATCTYPYLLSRLRILFHPFKVHLFILWSIAVILQEGPLKSNSNGCYWLITML